MAEIDVAATATGGQRRSRSARQGGRVGQLTRPTRQFRDQSSQRQVGGFDNAGTGFAALAESVNTFFGTASTILEQKEEKEDREKDLQAARRAFNFVAANRKEAVQAVQTGDYSRLPKHVQDAIALKAGFNELRRATGQVMGNDMSEEFHLRLAADPEQDAEALQEQMLREELRGADDLMREQATTQFMNQTGRTVGMAKQAEVTERVVENFTLLRDSIQSELEAGEIMTSEDITRIETKAFAIGSLVGPQTALKYREQAAFEIMKFARDPKNGGQALRLLDIPNEDGIRLADRYPAEAQAAREFHLQEMGRVQTAEERASLMFIEDDLLKGKVGLGESLDRLDQHEEAFGTTNSSMTLRGQLLKQVDDDSLLRTVMDDLRGGQLPFLQRDEWVDVGHVVMAQTISEAIQMTQNGNVDGAQNLLAAASGLLADARSTPELKNMMSRMMKSSDPQQRDLAVQIMNGVQSITGDVEGFLDNDAEARYLAIARAREAGTDEDIALEQLQDNRQKRIEGVNPNTVFSKVHQLTPTDVISLRNATVENTLDLAKQNPRLAGADRVGQDVGMLIEREARRLAALDPNASPESVFNTASSNIIGKLIPRYIDGDMVLEVKAPFRAEIGVDQYGNPALPRDYGTADVKEMLDGPLKNLLPSGLDADDFGADPRTVGVENARRAAKGLPPLTREDLEANRLSVPFTVVGVNPNDISFDGGAQITLREERTGAQWPAKVAPTEPFFPASPERLESEIFKDMPVVKVDGETMIQIVPKSVNERLAWVRNPENGWIELRVFPPRMLTPAEERAILEKSRREELERQQEIESRARQDREGNILSFEPEDRLDAIREAEGF